MPILAKRFHPFDYTYPKRSLCNKSADGDERPVAQSLLGAVEKLARGHSGWMLLVASGLLRMRSLLNMAGRTSKV